MLRSVGALLRPRTSRLRLGLALVREVRLRTELHQARSAGGVQMGA